MQEAIWTSQWFRPAMGSKHRALSFDLATWEFNNTVLRIFDLQTQDKNHFTKAF